MKSSFFLWAQLCPGSATERRSALPIPTAFPAASLWHPCGAERRLFRGGCSTCRRLLLSRGGCCAWSGVQSGTWLSPPCQLSGWRVCSGMRSTSSVALVQLLLSPKQQGNWKRDDVSWYVAPCSRLIAKSLHLIAGLCFSLVYWYSDDILPATDLSFPVTVF